MKLVTTQNANYTEQEEIDVNVNLEEIFYAAQEKEIGMLVDTGCPSTLVGKSIMDAYLSKMTQSSL